MNTNPLAHWDSRLSEYLDGELTAAERDTCEAHLAGCTGCARLLEELKRLQCFDNTFIVVLSDHGEEFQDHGSFGHGGRLWEELLRVPMVMKFPLAARVPPTRVTTPVRQLDVLPTVLAQLQLASESAPVQGVDLLP